MLASDRNGTIYTGVTSDLIKRVWQHRNDFVPGFSNKYRVHRLVWFEQHPTMISAIAREKAIKKWRRAWKLELIETENPRWRDLYEDLVGPDRAETEQVHEDMIDPGMRARE
jgi:putative endonuclease